MPIPIGPGIGIGTLSPQGSPSPVAFFSDVFTQQLTQRWPLLAALLESELVSKLGAPDLLARGFTLYDIEVGVDRTPPVLSLSRENDGDLLVSCTTGRCRIAASSTQPTVFGKWADPRLGIGFGLAFSFTISLPTTTSGSLRVSSLRSLRVLAPDIDSMSLLTDIVFFFDDVAAFFSGTRFVEHVQDAIADHDFADLVNGKFLDDALVPVNRKLGELWDAGFWYLQALVDTLDGTGELTTMSLSGAPSDQLSLALLAEGVDRTGMIEGTIEWPRAFGSFRDTRVHPLAAAREKLQRFSVDSAIALSLTAAAEPSPAPVQIPDEFRGQVEMTQLPASTVQAESTPLSDAIRAARFEERGILVQDALSGSRARLRALLGAAEVHAQLVEIARGVDDLVVQAVMDKPGEPGQFTGGTAVVSEMAALWEDDDEETFRRHYRLRKVATGVLLDIQVAAAEGWAWSGPAWIAEPSGWRGFVTVKPMKTGSTMPVKPLFVRPRAVLSTAVFAGGAEVLLNPQPLPPKEGPEAQVNPQPLPPKEDPRHGGVRIRDIAHQLKHPLGDTVRETVRPTGGTPITSLAGHFGAAEVESTSSLQIGGSAVHISPDIAAHIADIVELVRDNPKGRGAVYGIDFGLVEYVPPVIH